MMSLWQSRISRRALMKASVVAGAGIAFGNELFAAESDSASPLITKAIPSTGEKIPVIGIGTNAYSVTSPEDIAARREVLQNLPHLGGKVVDTARGYGESEEVIGRLVGELGNRDKLFFATKTPMSGDMSDPAAVLQESFRRLRTERLDLLQVHNLHGLDELFPVMREWKQAGKIRYLGVTTSTNDQYEGLSDALRKLPLDFIQVDYSIDNRDAERDILPLAAEKRVAVLVNMPLGGRRTNLLPKLAEKKLPSVAADVGATSWAQFLLKYAVSHPVVTCAIPGTTKVSHLRDNQMAARGRLPDAALRKEMEKAWERV